MGRTDEVVLFENVRRTEAGYLLVDSHQEIDLVGGEVTHYLPEC